MLYFLLILIFNLAFLFLIVKNPLSIGLILLIETCLVAVRSGSRIDSFWFSYILFLIFLGGILILFIYVASLASNEQFVFNFKRFFFIIGGRILFFLIFIKLDLLLLTKNISFYWSFFSNSFISPNVIKISSLYSNSSFLFTLFIISYLLLILFIVVKIIKNVSSPLRLLN